MITIALLNWLSEAITGLVVIFTLINAVKNSGFSPLDWGLTAAALLFALFVKIIADITAPP